MLAAPLRDGGRLGASCGPCAVEVAWMLAAPLRGGSHVHRRPWPRVGKGREDEEDGGNLTSEEHKVILPQCSHPTKQEKITLYYTGLG
jgi:hypothetical protein